MLFFPVLAAHNKGLSYLLICPLDVLWDVCHWFRSLVVDVNDILAFGLRMMSFGMRVLCSQGRGISITYALDCICPVQICC
jgi:hypothetical protein